MSVHNDSTRAKRLNALAKERMDLFWWIIWSLLLMQQRGISQKEVAEVSGINITTVAKALKGAQTVEALERNLLAIDKAITVISDKRKGKA